jgi:hypothetical protein
MAYIPNTILTDGWYENQALRETGTQILGLEKWCSITYEKTGRYPASLTVTTLKTLILMDEQELLDKTRVTLTASLPANIIINESTIIEGDRMVLMNHKTHFIAYDGVDTSNALNETVKLIGEIWNCPTSGISIICTGIAYITNNTDDPNIEHTENWETIVQDPNGVITPQTGKNGLIYNVICHS